MSDILFMVIPCYNEEAVLPETSRQLKEKLEHMIQNGIIDAESRIVFVDDGPQDKT